MAWSVVPDIFSFTFLTLLFNKIWYHVSPSDIKTDPKFVVKS